MSQYTVRELLDLDLLESLEDVLALENEDKLSEVYENYCLIRERIEALRQLPMDQERDQQIYRLQAKIRPYEAVLKAAHQDIFGDSPPDTPPQSPPQPALTKTKRKRYVEFALALAKASREELTHSQISAMTDGDLFHLICRLSRKVSRTGIEVPFGAAKQIGVALDQAGTGFRPSDQIIGNILKKCLENERF